ncbi:MAG: PAS domain S-box protein, partial [Halobacteriota archaeon]|nr:PAS domain S-box protein [Halobacteriota archaeon]
MSKKKLQVLIVEDSINDAELIILELKHSGYDLEWDIVRRVDEMNRALKNKEWDVIISDFNLPGFSGLEALVISRVWDPDIPFILISGNIGEETAVEVMRYGASDYINKKHLSRLVPALKRELADAEARRDHKNAQKALRESEEQYRSFVVNFQGVAFRGYGDYNFDFLHGNIDLLTGYNERDFTSGSVNFDQLIHPKDSEWVREDLNRFMSSSKISTQRKYRIQDKYGGVHWILESISKFYSSNGSIGLYGTIQDITELENTIEMLQKSESRYKELFENMSSGVAVYGAVDDGEDMVFIDFNSSGEKIEGVKREEIIGRRVTDVFPGVENFGILDVFKRVWRTGLPEHHPTSMYADDRIAGWRENYVYKLPSGEVVAVYDDITERKQAEDDLRKSEEKYRTILEGIEEAYYEVDLSGDFTFFNDSLCRIFGYSREELTFMNYADCMDDENADRVKNILNETYQKGEFVEAFDCEIIRKNGNRKVVGISVSIVSDNSDEPVGFRGIIRDITERKIAEDNLQKAYEALKAVDTMKSEFAAIATHEIGTPLSVIKTNTEMLKDGMFGNLTKAQQERLEVIKKNTDHLVKLNR